MDPKTQAEISRLTKEIARLDGANQSLARSMREGDAKTLEEIRGFVLTAESLDAIEERLAKSVENVHAVATESLEAVSSVTDLVDRKLKAFGGRIDKIEGELGELRADVEKLISETRWTRRAID